MSGYQRLLKLARGWSRDELLRRLMKNAGYLVRGNMVAAGLGLVALAASARALGPELLGVLALIEAYTGLVDRLIRLEPWQALIKYGADALERDRPADFRSLLKFGVLIDAGGAACGALVAITFVAVVGPWLGWSEQTVHMAAVYSASLLFQLAATPTAVLRLFDRFAVFAWLEVAAAGARAASFALAFLAGAGLWTFLLLAMAVHFARHFALGLIAWRELRRQGHGGFPAARVAGVAQRCPGIWSLIWSLKASNLIRRSTGTSTRCSSAPSSTPPRSASTTSPSAWARPRSRSAYPSSRSCSRISPGCGRAARSSGCAERSFRST